MKRVLKVLILILVSSMSLCGMVCVASANESGNTYYVSIDGNASGAGSLEDPWEISHALSNQSGTIKPGDTIYIRGGVYDTLVGEALFSVNLNGENGKCITIKPYQNERVVFDAHHVSTENVGYEKGFSINGSWLIIQDIFFTNSNGLRDGRIGANSINTGVNIFASNSKLINCFIYNNNGVGIGFWKPATNSELYGCHVFHNGYYDNSNGAIAGHNIYTQNVSGTKIISDNVVFGSARIGIHVYYEGDHAPEDERVLRGFDLTNNILFDNGSWGGTGEPLNVNLDISSSHPSRDMKVLNNIGYQSQESAQQNFMFGPSFHDVDNTNFEVSGNIASGGQVGYEMNRISDIKFVNNKVVGPGTSNPIRIMIKKDRTTEGYHFNNNSYYLNEYSKLSFGDGRIAENEKPEETENIIVKSLYNGWHRQTSDLPTWQTMTGLDQASTVTYVPSASAPSESENFHVLSPNKYENGRGNLTIFNFTGNASYTVDLSPVVAANSQYYIYDSQNVLDEPILKGVYQGGTIDIPMNLTKITGLTGLSSQTPNHTSNQFGSYLVMSRPLAPEHKIEDPDGGNPPENENPPSTGENPPVNENSPSSGENPSENENPPSSGENPLGIENAPLIVESPLEIEHSPSSGKGILVTPTTKDQANRPIQVKIKLNTKVNAKGNAEVMITEKAIMNAYKKALDEAKKNGNKQNEINLMIEAYTGNTTVNKVTFNLPKKVQDFIISKGIANTVFAIASANITLEVNSAAVKEIKKQAGTDVNIIVTHSDYSKLSNRAKTAIGNRPLFDLSVRCSGNGKLITNFGKGRISVVIPYALKAREKATNIHAVYVNAKGKVTWLYSSVYDQVEETLRFRTNHFSIYGVGYKENISKSAPILEKP